MLLIKTENVKKYFVAKKHIFSTHANYLHAVDGVGIEIEKGEVFGLVGESGCGKTTLGKLFVRLEDVTDGNIFINLGEEGKDNYINISHIKGSALKDFRKNVQMIFQDPYESLNPRFTIFDSVVEPILVQNIGAHHERFIKVKEILEEVGLIPPEDFLFRYPHELSGGQRQRVAIARALIVGPKFVIADEPTSMLDASIRAGVINMMLKLKEEYDLTYIFVTHDLTIARYMCSRIAVMYLGKIVEMGRTENVINLSHHPYTKALISSIPVPDPGHKREKVKIRGGVKKQINPEDKCYFMDRCDYKKDICETSPHPKLKEIDKDHYVACYLYG